MSNLRSLRVLVTVVLVLATAVALVLVGAGLVMAADPQAEGDTHYITASAGTGGIIEPEGVVAVVEPADQTFSISANTGYEIDDVLVDGTSEGAVASYTFPNVTADHTISATFARLTYSLAYSAGAGGRVTGDTSQTVAHGEDGTAVTADPDTGYRFTGWSDGVETATRTDTNVTADLAVSATFARLTYTITSSAGIHGTISPLGAQTVTHGTEQAFTIDPATGYHVADVLVDGDSVGARTSYTFSDVTADHTISASFAIDTFTITASAATHGTISPPGAQTVDYGASQTFTIAAAKGYYIADVLVDGLSIGPVPSYDFATVTANHTISASFAVGKQTRFEVRAGRSTVDYGTSTVLSGVLYDASDPLGEVGMGDRSVTVQSASSAAGPWVGLETLTTSAAIPSVGTFSLTVTPTSSIYYRVRFVAEAGSHYGDSLSYVVRVGVRPLLSVPKVRSSVRSRRSFTVYGTLRPHFPAGERTVKVKVYRNKNRRWVFVKQVSATTADSGSNTRYAVKVKLTTKGKYRFRAFTVATATWAGDTTPLSTVLTVR